MMKKYLMTGLVAVALSGLFSGCSQDIETGEENTTEFNILQTYEDAFVTRFGQPAENQNWGFGNGVGSTRYNNPGEDVPYTSDAINANANEWADATPGKTYGGWVVPDPLTRTQKDVVRAYFQANPNLRNEDPHWRHFFVQQVYKGHTNPPTTGNKEVTTAANGTSTYTSDNMNLLTVGHDEQHLNDFNNGTRSWKGVLDKDYTANDYEGHHHSDQISLMVNIDDTSCFGYHNSGNSIQRNDKWALVGWETIRTWANNNGLDGDCLADGWNRSFMGFDFELYTLEDSYAKEGNNHIYAPINDVSGNALEYVWDGTKVMKRGIASANVRRNGSRAGVNVNGSYYYRVNETDNPADGHVEYLYAGSELIGKITFGGTGESAFATDNWGGFTAKIYRPYVKFTALNTGGNLYFTQDKHENDGCECIVLDETTNTVKTSSVINYANWCIGVEGGHTYKFYYSTGADLGFYGLYYEVWGQSIEDPDAGTDNESQGNDDQSNNDSSGSDNNSNNDNNGDDTQNQEENYDFYGEDTYIIIDGKKIPYLKTDMSMYGGIKRTLSDSDMKIIRGGKECLNLPKFKELVDDDYLPVKDTNLRTWVKWQGGDGYFSDWIVTLTKAERIGTPTPPVNPPTYPTNFVCRIIAEDLTIGERSDFDFNDVVFDVLCDGSTTTIRLRAAGGELPLYVAGQEVHQAFSTKYPGITSTTLVNTGWKGSTLDYDNYYVDFTIGGVYNDVSSCNNIPVVVTKKGRNDELIDIELTARTGKVASKVCVGSDYKWCSERQDIDEKYHLEGGVLLFHEYVKGHYGGEWWNNNAWYQQLGQ